MWRWFYVDNSGTVARWQTKFGAIKGDEHAYNVIWVIILLGNALSIATVQNFEVMLLDV
jgi:hypothetical protein